MRLDRLKTLADYLRTVPPEKFNYEVWWCGTQGCALGHACSIPEFQKAGLRLSIPPNKNCRSLHVLYGEAEGGEAAQLFFDLPVWDADYLFYPTEDEPIHNPIYVADKIDAFINLHQEA